MPGGEWPPFTVRNWASVLGMRDPDWGSLEEDHDDTAATEESRRLHELRGIIIGQVAEIENLLLHIASQIRERSVMGTPPRKRGPGGAGRILDDVEMLLEAIGLKGEFTNHIKSIRQTIHQRNAIVHAVIHVGFDYIFFNDSRNSVIVLLVDNDDRRRPGQVTDSVESTSEEIDQEIDERQLEHQLTDAYEALERCVDIWAWVDNALPDIRPQ